MSELDITPIQAVFISYKAKVNASVPTVWKVLLDKIRRPDKYVPGVVKVEILKELGPNAIERRMETATGQVIAETISADALTKTVLFKHHNDPKLSGMVTNVVYEENDGKDVFVEFVMSWTAKSIDSSEEDKKIFEEMKARMSAGMIKGAVLKTKEHAEAAEKETKEQ